jgi:hypothetical protein
MGTEGRDLLTANLSVRHGAERYDRLSAFACLTALLQKMFHLNERATTHQDFSLSILFAAGQQSLKDQHRAAPDHLRQPILLRHLRRGLCH